jgi:hypothetical protein
MKEVDNGLFLAHTLGAGGPEIEVLILAVAFMWLGVLFYWRKAVKPPISIGLVLMGMVLVAGSFALGR